MGQGQYPLRDGVDTVKNQSITSLPRSPEEDRRARMIKYSLAMGIRMLCILSLLFVQGWWLVVMAIGAIVLPYIAVVLANVGARSGIGAEAPSGREIMIRNPQAPIIVPPAEETASQHGEQRAWAGEQGSGETGQRQAGEWRFPESGEQQRFPQSGSGEWRFPGPGEQSFPRPAEQPFDRPAEGQA